MLNSLIEPPFVPVWGRAFEQGIFFVYNGASMTPLFRPGDILCAQKIGLEQIQVWDIVIVDWGKEIKHEYVVHRVVSLKSNGFITQGDNNFKTDERWLTAENLIGKVICFGRNGKVYTTQGRILGLLFSRLILARNLIWLLIRRLGWRMYRLVRQSGWIARFWHPTIRKIRVMTDQGFLIKYCHGSRTIAHWWLDAEKFDVVKPFDLVISHPEESK